jgi:hypothetical protein
MKRTATAVATTASAVAVATANVAIVSSGGMQEVKHAAPAARQAGRDRAKAAK